MAKEFKHEQFTQDHIDKCAWSITDILRNYGGQDSEQNVIVAAYLLKVANAEKYPYVEFDDLMSMIPVANRKLIEKISSIEKLWHELKVIARYFPKEVFREVALGNYTNGLRNGNYVTPTPICKLSSEILDIQSGDFVGDICCGRGSYLTFVSKEYPEAIVQGVELSEDDAIISAIRYSLVRDGEALEQVELKNRFYDRILFREKRNAVINEDVFMGFGGYQTDQIYDKAFSNYPWNVRLGNQRGFQEYIRDSKLYHVARTRCSSDWFFNEILVDSIKESGKAVGIMTLGSGWNKTDENARKYFVENGFVEAVIRLPEKIFNNTMVATNLIVLSHNNDCVRFIDARNEYVEGRRFNEISDENIRNIMRMLFEDSDTSKLVSVKEIEKNEYVLSPERYLLPQQNVENGVKLKNLLKAIKRAAPLTASQLDEASTNEETHIRYVRLADIQDGYLNEDLPCLAKCEGSWEKYFMKDNDLIISKIVQPFKTAIIHLEDNEKILPIGNMYVLEVDENKINPYYLKAFFESESGRSMLSKANTGSVIPIISVDVLKNLVIPVPDMAIQNKIADRYMDALEEVRVTKLQLAKAIDKLYGAFDEGKGGS